jgi:hypothetical protein
MRVYKYPIEPKLFQNITLPKDHELLKVDTQPSQGEDHGQDPYLWARVNVNSKEIDYQFICAPTGKELKILNPNYSTHVDTFQQYMGDLIWHVFKVDQIPNDFDVSQFENEEA